MVCRTEVVGTDGGERRYTFCPDPLPAMADRVQSLMHGRLLDELTGNPLRGDLNVMSSLVGVWPRASSDAVAGLVANPARRFPGLAAGSVDLRMSVGARRFLTQTFHGTLGPFNTGVGHPADFPDHFSPINLGDIGMHREPTVLTGRCALNDGVNRTPLNDAAVNLTGVYHHFPAANVDPLTVVEAPNILAVLHGLYNNRLAGVTQVRQRVLQPQVGEEKILLAPAMAGTDILRLSDHVNLAIGQVVGVEIGHSDREEYLEVVGVDGASTDTQPATITLAHPLRCDHRAGVSVVRMNTLSVGASNNLSRDAIVGDKTLFLDALNGLDNTAVEITGTGPAEYHSVRLYTANSDADGYFRLPPITRVAMLHLQASHPISPTSVDILFSPDYDQLSNRVDLIFG